MSTHALGRGLGSLIPQKKTLTEQILPDASTEVRDISVDQIRPNPRQPRLHFSPADLEDLLNSIKEHGIMVPLVVTRQSDGYELIAGERRLRASKLLGLKTVPAIVREASEQEKLELALIENIQRADLNALEEAIAYKALMDEFNLTQEQVAQRVGKNRSTVANIVRLLELSEPIQEALREGRISKSHARTLLAEMDPKKRQELFLAMSSGELTVRAAEERVRQTLAGGKSPTKIKDPNIAAHEQRLREALGTKVEIKERAGKGTIAVHFFSREELMDLLARLS